MFEQSILPFEAFDFLYLRETSTVCVPSTLVATTRSLVTRDVTSRGGFYRVLDIRASNVFSQIVSLS